MDYFDSEKNVDSYIKMTRNYDGSELIALLKQHLAVGSTILELGMGPGKDFDLLKADYEITGSDKSKMFLDKYHQRNNNATLLQLDALTIETDSKFQCIYSNKVLHHLSKTELKKSLSRQSKVLTNNGLIFHTFWEGDKIEEYHGLRFVYYPLDELRSIINDYFDVIEIGLYKEMKKNDSIYVIARKK